MKNDLQCCNCHCFFMHFGFGALLLYIANLSQVKNGRKKTMMLMTMLIELCDNPF